jgi:hypothetical protein
LALRARPEEQSGSYHSAANHSVAQNTEREPVRWPSSTAWRRRCTGVGASRST